ncbi:MAG: hypothetical protein AAGF01_03255 [Cyanobacteria bacterium P01_G01_bin.38]
MTQLYLLGAVALTMLLAVLALSLIAPVQVAYTEEIVVEAPVEAVYDDIRLQERLMWWSAWPFETNSTCAVDGKDGEVGAKTLFFTKGKSAGYQEVTRLKKNEIVEMVLVGPGPPHRPRMTFELQSAGANRTRVLAYFVNELPRPFNAIWKFAGFTKWTREMHCKDLAGLKAFSEPPHKDATGKIVGRPPEGLNPFVETASSAV